MKACLSMLSKAKIKYIKSLHLKKNRMQDKLFLVEGSKSVLELLNSTIEVAEVFGTEGFWNENKNEIKRSGVSFELVGDNELDKAGTLTTNNAALALAKIPEPTSVKLSLDRWTLALDQINDPGNLGTIIRIADWYGIEQIIISENSVDAYNPKTVSASKGSLSRVQVHYADLHSTLSAYTGTILGADMEGTNVHVLEAPKGGVLVMGSESHGISGELDSLLTQRITIPRLGGAESLNVAVATAIICDCLLGR